jgi:hypothetical protein
MFGRARLASSESRLAAAQLDFLHKLADLDNVAEVLPAALTGAILFAPSGILVADCVCHLAAGVRGILPALNLKFAPLADLFTQRANTYVFRFLMFDFLVHSASKKPSESAAEEQRVDTFVWRLDASVGHVNKARLDGQRDV